MGWTTRNGDERTISAVLLRLVDILWRLGLKDVELTSKAKVAAVQMRLWCGATSVTPKAICLGRVARHETHAMRRKKERDQRAKGKDRATTHG